MASPEIRHQLDPTRLAAFSEKAREIAEELGELDGKHHYLDLSFASWEDVAYALATEGRLIADYQAADDPADILAEFEEMQQSEDEREALWQLELGVAAPVMALNVLGAHTALSCNGGEFGGAHLREFPSIRFYPHRASVSVLLELARESGVGLVEEEGRALIYANSVVDLQGFAALAIQRFGPKPIEVVQDDARLTFEEEGVHILRTEGVNGCCGVALLNHTQGWAGLLHYSDAIHQLDEIEAVLDAAKAMVSPGDHVEIWVGGCDDSDPATRKEAHESRANLEKALSQRFNAPLNPQWLSRRRAYINVVVRTNPPKIETETF